MWDDSIRYLLIGAFLANGLPHFLNGLSGNHWPRSSRLVGWVNESTPRTRRLTAPIVNVIWGAFNLMMALSLYLYRQDFQLGHTGQTCWFFSGLFLTAVILAWNFTPRNSSDPA